MLHQTILLRTLSSWPLKTPKDRDPTGSLSNLFQCLITLRRNIVLYTQSQSPVSTDVHYHTMDLGEEAGSIFLVTSPQALAGCSLVT